jgi:hypothetical protein
MFFVGFNKREFEAAIDELKATSQKEKENLLKEIDELKKA